MTSRFLSRIDDPVAGLDGGLSRLDAAISGSSAAIAAAVPKAHVTMSTKEKM
jgi:hypothetical protein